MADSEQPVAACHLTTASPHLFARVVQCLRGQGPLAVKAIAEKVAPNPPAPGFSAPGPPAPGFSTSDINKLLYANTAVFSMPPAGEPAGGAKKAQAPVWHLTPAMLALLP